MWQQFFPSSHRPFFSSLVYSQGSFKTYSPGLIIFQAYCFILFSFFLFLLIEKKKHTHILKNYDLIEVQKIYVYWVFYAVIAL